MDAELIVSINVSLDSNSSDHRSDSEVEAQLQPICSVTIELSSYAVLSDVQVCVDVFKPLVVADDFYALPNLCKQARRHSCLDVSRQPNSQLPGERHATKTRVYVDGDLPAFSSEIRATVTYRTDAGVLRSVRRTSQLPLKTMLRSCPPESSASFVTVIKSGAPLLTFTQMFPGKRVLNSVPSIDGPNLSFICLAALFVPPSRRSFFFGASFSSSARPKIENGQFVVHHSPKYLRVNAIGPWLRNANVVCSEFSADQSQRQGWNALGLRHLNSGHTVTVVSGNAGNRYRVQSNDGLSSTLVVSRLIDRSRSKNEESVGATIGQNHIRLVHQRIDDHFAARQKINRITVSTEATDQRRLSSNRRNYAVLYSLSRIERDRPADESAEKRGKKNVASRERKKRAISARYRIAVPLRFHL